MNLVGKIFIVLITLFSFVFMSFAVAVYATHRNWYQVVNRTRDETPSGEQIGLKFQLEEGNKRRAALQEEFDKYKAEVAEAEVAKRQALAKLETQRDDLTTKRDALQKELDDLVETDKKALTTLHTAQKNLDKLTQEVEKLRNDIRVTQADRDKQFQAVVKLTDQIHESETSLVRLKDRNMQLAKDVAKATEVLRRHNLSAEEPDGPVDVRGKILAVNAENLVEVSIGSDDGLRAGAKLEVFRGSNYLGRVEVMKTDTDRSVAKILPEFKRGIIQKGDDVATRLKVG